MATIRKVPDYYATLQEAHDAADEGDTILLAPGDYDRFVTGTKLVHLKGDTQDPIHNPVKIHEGGRYKGDCLAWNHEGEGLWIVEGITFEKGETNGKYYAVGVNMRGWPEGLSVHFNRCVFNSNTSSILALGHNGGSSVRATFTHCEMASVGDAYATTYPEQIGYIRGDPANQIELLACRLGILTPKWYAIPKDYNPGAWQRYILDVVDTLTPGYGAQYGSMIWDEGEATWRKQVLAGRVQFGHQPHDQASVRVFRAYPDGTVEPTPWAERTPDPITGEWLFDYLPTDAGYFVECIPAPGHQPRIEGPYFAVPL